MSYLRTLLLFPLQGAFLIAHELWFVLRKFLFFGKKLSAVAGSGRAREKAVGQKLQHRARLKTHRAVSDSPTGRSRDAPRAHLPGSPGWLRRPALRVPPAAGAVSAWGTAHLCKAPSRTETGALFQYGLLQLSIEKPFLVLLIPGKSALDWLLYLGFSRALGSSLLMVFRCRMKAAFAGDMLNHSRLPLLMLRGERARFLELPSSPGPSCHGHSACRRDGHWGRAGLRTISAVSLIIKRTHQKKRGNALAYRFCSFFSWKYFAGKFF